MELPYFESSLQAVVVGIRVIGHSQNVPVIRKLGLKWPGVSITTARIGITRRTRIHIAPCDQIASCCSHVSNAERRVTGHSLLYGQVVGMVHWRLEVTQDLHNVEWWIGLRASVTKNVHPRSH